MNNWEEIMNGPSALTRINSYNIWLLRGIALCLVVLVIGGCATQAHQQAVAGYNVQYSQQLAVIESIVRAQQGNGTKIELYPDGRVKSLTVPQQIQIPDMPQYRPPVDKSAEVWGSVAKTALKVGGSLVGISLVGDIIEAGYEAAGNSYEVGGDMVGSGNTAGGDYNGITAGRDIGTGTITDIEYNSSYNDGRSYGGDNSNTDNDNSNNSDNRTYQPPEETEPETE